MDQNHVLLSLTGICKSFVGVQALKDVSLRIQKNTVHALIGENGAGKSTLMKILAGAYQMDAGEIQIEGKPVKITSPTEAREQGIGIIYQELSLIRQMNAVENLFLGQLWTKRGVVDWKGMRKRAAEIFENIGLKINMDVAVRELSIGQCQLIEICRAMVNQSKVIIMDEPTSSLTDGEIEQLFGLIKRLKKNGISIIYISHRLEELFQIADYASVLKDGQNAGEFVISDTNKDELVQAMVGRELKDYYPAHDYQPGEILLDVKDLSYEGLLKNMSFQVRRGEVVGFSGLIGAGRSETMHALFGSYGQVKGNVNFLGKPLVIKSPKKAIDQGVAFAPEDRKNQGLILPFSIMENISLANMKAISGKRGVLSRKKENTLAQKYKEQLKIVSPSVKKRVDELSGGNQQKVIVAKWLNTNADLYIFDEPTRGVDVGAKAEIYQMIRNLACQGKGVIMVSSELPEILGVSDRVIVMREGEVKCNLSANEATEERVMMYAVGGNQHEYGN